MMIDLDCERVGPGLWGEPLNALSNLAFVAVALALALRWRLWRRGADQGLRWLVLLMAAIGIGSTLFHTFANAASQMADVLPILLFQLLFLGLYLRRCLGFSLGVTLIVVAVFLVLCLLARGWSKPLNGSLAYAPALGALLLLGIHQWRFRLGPPLLLGAAALFGLSLTFRSLDLALCDSYPHGSHFLWHLLNSLVLALSAWSVLPPQPSGLRAGRLR
jgi:hypothetical protein